MRVGHNVLCIQVGGLRVGCDCYFNSIVHVLGKRVTRTKRVLLSI